MRRRERVRTAIFTFKRIVKHEQEALVVLALVGVLSEDFKDECHERIRQAKENIKILRKVRA